MAILFSISIFAFCALLWASFSVARHLRRPTNPERRDHIARRSGQVFRGSR